MTLDAPARRDGLDPWGGPSFWVAFVILFALLLAVPASQCRWTVDDPYMLPFANTTLRDAYAQWMPLWGFERLQTPLLCHLQYPLGEGLCHLLRAVVHLACAALYGVLLVRLGWGRAVAASTALLYVILPFQIEPVLLPNFQSLLSQPAILIALLCFIRGAEVGAKANVLWWALSLGLAFVATLGHGSYLFSPLLLLTLPFCPARRGWRSPPAATLVAAAACALVPIAVSVLLHVVHRYPLRGEPTVVAFPKIVFAMQYRCLVWTATNLWHAVTHPQVPYLLAQAAVLLPAALLATRGLAAAARAEDTVAGPPSRERLAWFACWAYAWILVGYSVYFLTGGATGTARQNYVASMGIAACLGLLVTRLVRTRLGKPLIAAGIGLTCLGTLAIGWKYVRWTEDVSACIAGREGNPAVPTFVDLYTACAREAWAAAAPARRSLSYDVYNVRNWVVTGFTGFLPRTDPRPLETQMAQKLVEAYSRVWPSLDDAARRRITQDVDRRLASVEPRDGSPTPGADSGSEQDVLASLTKRTETLFDRLQARAPIAATPP